jgi:hypothetical protein
MNSDLLMIILMIMMSTMMMWRIIRLKKVVIGHNVIDSVKPLRQHHGNVVVNLLLLVPDPGIEGTTRPKLLQGLALVVLVLGFLWKSLFQKAVLWRDRKLHLGLGDLVPMLASNLQA